MESTLCTLGRKEKLEMPYLGKEFLLATKARRKRVKSLSGIPDIFLIFSFSHVIYMLPTVSISSKDKNIL